MMSDIPLEVKHPKHWDLLHLHGLIPRLHATHASFHDSRLDAKINWRSRDHRKGRRVRVSQKGFSDTGHCASRMYRGVPKCALLP